MRTPLTVILYGGLVLGVVSVDRVSRPGSAAGPSRSLAIAVAAFNSRSAAHLAAEGQPPLSQEEVLAAIREWPTHADSSLTRDATDQIEEISAARDVPHTMRLHKSFMQGSGSPGPPSVCEIQLTILDKSGTPHVVAIRRYPLRAQAVSSPPQDVWKPSPVDRVRSVGDVLAGRAVDALGSAFLASMRYWHFQRQGEPMSGIFRRVGLEIRDVRPCADNSGPLESSACASFWGLISDLGDPRAK